MKILSFITILLFTVACKKQHEDNLPPPIVEGKCLADVYDGQRAMTQGCVYVGYNWACAWTAGDEARYTCKRGLETGAAPERAPVEPAKADSK